MKRILYPGTVVSFLNDINQRITQDKSSDRLKVLDCGAGGETPPLGLFCEYGFDTAGIEISKEQLRLAQTFELENGMALNIELGNMKALPYDTETSDAVYEYHSMGHLTKQDTVLALDEMYRVLKPGGLCFVGFMMSSSWPIIGKTLGDGEYNLIEAGESVIHSVYDESEILEYLKNWTIIKSEMSTTRHVSWADHLNVEGWLGFYEASHSDVTENEWIDMLPDLKRLGNYTHTHLVLKKER